MKKTDKDKKHVLEKMDQSANGSDVLLAYMDPQFNFIHVNKAYADADKRDPNFFPGKNHFDLYPNDENEAIFRRVVETGEPYSAYAKPFIYANNPERGVSYWDWTLQPVKATSGETTGLLFRAVDVTKHVRMEEELRNSEAYFRQLFDESPLPAGMAGFDYRFRMVNKAFCQMLGYSADEMLSLTVMDVTHSDDLLADAVQRDALAAGEIDQYQIDKRFVRKDGAMIWVRFWARLLRDKEGTSLHLMLLVEDITDEKRAEEELKLYHERLEQMVGERTTELAEANAKLQQAIVEHECDEEKLRETNEQLNNILSSISDGFFTLDNQMVVTYFNQAAEHLVGRKAEIVVGRPLFDAFPEARGSVFEEKYTYALKHKVALSFETYFGVEPLTNWYDVRVYPFKDGISVYFQVTTARREAEEAIRISEEKLRLVTDSLPALIGYVDADRRFLFNNKLYGEWFKQPQAELAGKHMREVLGEASYRKVAPYVEKVLSGQPVRFEVVFEFEGGLQKPVEGRYVPHIDGEGNVQGFFALVTDISERKQFEAERERLRKEAEEERDRLMTLLNTVSDEVWFCDTKGNVTLLNVAAEKGGFTPEDVNQPLHQWLQTVEILDAEGGHPRPTEDAPLLRSLRGETVRNFEEIVRDPLTGLLRYREGSSTPLRRRDGRIVGAVAAVRDVSARKRAEIALRESETRFRELSEHLEQKVREKVVELQQAETLAAIGRMVSVVAHEVRNPLQKIGMGVETLKSDLGQDSTELEILDEIAFGVDSLNGIIGDLLNYSRPIKLDPAPVRIEDLVEQAISLLHNKLPNISLSIKLDRPQEELRVDRMKFVQVLANLISNSADAMPDGGTMTIQSSYNDNAGIFSLSVSDTGHGIKEHDIKKIFEPFFTTKVRGTGLGLAFCKKIIEAHHGELRITSKEGNGTTAEIILPAT